MSKDKKLKDLVDLPAKPEDTQDVKGGAGTIATTDPTNLPVDGTSSEAETGTVESGASISGGRMGTD